MPCSRSTTSILRSFIERSGEYRWTGRPWRNWDAQCAAEETAGDVGAVASGFPRAVTRYAQSVSAFFQPAVRARLHRRRNSGERLVERFGDRLDRLALGWFESHLRAHPRHRRLRQPGFDVERGYQIIETPNVKLLLMRCEGLAVAPAGTRRSARAPITRSMFRARTSAPRRPTATSTTTSWPRCGPRPT